MTTLTSKALLVSLQISQWQARKYDKRETQELMLKHGTAEGVARVNKSLLGNADSLEAIKKRTNAMRWDYYRNSLPWGQEGVNVIKADAYMDFVTLMRDHMWEWKALVRTFIAEYPDLRERAKSILNGMYRDEDYPDKYKLEDKFSCDLKFFPIPERSDWRVALSDDEMADLRKQTQDEINRSSRDAMKDAWARVHKVVEHAIGQLADPKTVFRDSLIENAREMCRTMTALNILDDPDLERIRSQIEGTLCGHQPEALREDPVLREGVTDKLKAIMDTMGQFYSAPA